MALILREMYRGYFWLFTEKADPRVDGYFLMSSPLIPFAIGTFYLYFVNELGPNLMKHRKPFNLKIVLMVYNIIQIVVNSYCIYQAGLEILNLNWFCAPVDYAPTPHNFFVLRFFYIYFLLKLLDLLDTVFYVLKKNQRQVTFLHVYHHFGMLGLSWTGMKFVGGGHGIYLGFCNCIVHAIMYFYYFITAWKPEYKQSAWWKKHLTQLQMIQFVFLLVTYGQLLFKPDCSYPKLSAYFFIPQNIFMLFLFGEFYWNAYIKKKETIGITKQNHVD